MSHQVCNFDIGQMYNYTDFGDKDQPSQRGVRNGGVVRAVRGGNQTEGKQEAFTGYKRKSHTKGTLPEGNNLTVPQC